MHVEIKPQLKFGTSLGACHYHLGKYIFRKATKDYREQPRCPASVFHMILTAGLTRPGHRSVLSKAGLSV